jgi:choline dehydrogenase-like flavoprotein
MSRAAPNRDLAATPVAASAGEPGAGYDDIVVGSGFGGSVSALRLVEKGYRVLCSKRGRELEERDFRTPVGI